MRTLGPALMLLALLLPAAALQAQDLPVTVVDPENVDLDWLPWISDVPIVELSGDWIFELTDPLRYEDGFLVEVRRAPRGDWRPGSASPFYVVQGETATAALTAARTFVLEHG